MKYIHLLILLCFIFIVSSIYSQDKLGIIISGDEKNDLEKRVIENSKLLKTITANFRQEKTSLLISEKSVSMGVFYYKNSGFLRWEYSSPEKYVLIQNKEKVNLKNEKGEILETGRMFKYLADFISNSINGNAIIEQKNFKKEYYKNDKNNSISIKLIPISKQIKQIYSEIIVELDTKTLLANEITMIEISGDITNIKFFDKKLNLDISLTIFE